MLARSPAEELAPPHSIECEQSLLGAVLQQNDAYLLAAEFVDSEKFFEPIHGKLWDMVGAKINAGQRINAVTVITELGPDAQLGYGGITVSKYIARLVSEATSTIGAPDYAKTIRELWQRRQIMSLARDMMNRAQGGFDQIGVDALIEEVDTELGAIRFGKDIVGACWIGEAAERSVDATAQAFQASGRPGLDSGIQALDEIIGPMFPGDLITILAPSGHGKTALLTQLLCRAAEPSLDTYRGKPAFLISGEMQDIQIARRVMASSTGISTRDQKTGDVVQGQFETLTDAARNMKGLRVMVDGSGRQTASSIARKCRAMKKRYDIGSVGMDHYKLLKAENPRWSKVDIIEHASEVFKDLAKELDIVFFGLAQPTREAQKSERTWRFTDQSAYGGDTLKQNSDIFLSMAIPRKWLAQREPDPSDQKAHDKWSGQMHRWIDKAEVGTLKVRDDEDGKWRELSFDGPRVLFGNL